MRLDALSADGMCGRNFIGRPTKRPVTKCLAKKRPDTKSLATKGPALKNLDPFDHLHYKFD